MTDDGKEKAAARILIVEDESILAEDLGLSLENLGYLVRGKVSSGKEAVKLAEALRPDLILMDIKLQGDIDGIEAADQIRTRLDIPVVYLTGYGEKDVLDRAKRTQPYGYLGKPCTFQELRSTIETALYKHKADKRVRESEERYRSLVEQSIDGIVVVQGTTVRFVNPALAKMFDYQSEEEMEGQDFLTFVAPEYRELMERRGIEREKGESAPSCYEFTALKKDGTPFAAELRVGLISYNGDKARQAIIRDISARKKLVEALRLSRDEFEQRVKDRTKELVAMTEALKASQSTLRLITDSLPALISYIDSEQRYRFCNKTYELWRGVPREEIEGRHLKEVLGDAAYEAAREYVEAALSGSPVVYEMAATYQDGKEKRLHVIYVPHLDETGKTKGFAGLITDITESKKIDEALRNSRDDLERRVMERIAEIAAINEELKMEIARRKNTEEALRREKDKAERYLDVAGVIIVALDREGRVTLINRKGCEILGYSAHEIIGTRWFDTYVPEADRDGTKAEFFRIIAGDTKAAKYFENSVLTRGGPDRLIAWHNTLLTNEDGSIVGTLSSGEDITDRKKAEEALRESEERFQLFMQHFPGLAYIKDADGRVLFANSGFGQYLGLDPSSMIGKTNHELFPTAFAEKITADDRSILESGEWQQIEEAYDDSVWSSHKFPIPRAGEESLLGGFSVDISERKQAENSLRESEEQYRALVETTDTGYVIVDHQGRVLDANAEYVRLTGHENLEEIRGRSVIEWTAERDRERNAREVEKCFKESFVRNLEIDYVDRRGDVIPIEINATVVLVKGHPQIVTLCRDITERKKAESQLKASLREKEVLLREIHHRVKNNLAVMQSMLRLQSRYAQSTEFSRMLEDAQNRIMSMALAHELLYQSENLSDVNVGQYVGKLVHHLVASLSEVGGRVKITNEIQNVNLGIDIAVPLGFILTELISNCLKHAFPEERCGEISVSLQTVGDKEFELRVHDDGVGMAADIDTEHPSAMGLDLVRIFVSQLSGTMEIVRDKGTGVRIRFRER